jgi:hypothetical protein
MENQNNTHWFRRNSKKLIIAYIIVVIVASLFLCEWMIKNQHGDNNHDFNNSRLPKRVIRMREWSPHSVITGSYTKQQAEAFGLSDNDWIIRTDRNGFVVPSEVYDDPEATIVFLGGSVVVCSVVPELERFPYRVGRQLENATGKKINSVNAGMSGNNSFHSINILINKIIPLKPEVVVMLHNINDIAILYHEGSYWNDNLYRGNILEIKKPTTMECIKQIIKNVLPHTTFELSLLIERIRTGGEPVDEFSNTRGADKPYDAEFMRQEFSKSLRMFIYICRAQKIVPVLMTMGSREDFWSVETDISGKRPRKEIFDLFNNIIREICAQEGVLLIDLEKDIPSDKRYIYDLVHLNTEGSYLAAELITKALLEDAAVKAVVLE